MTESLVFSIALVLVLGILAQYVAWQLRLPSILLLLILGFVSGPAVLGLVHPDTLMGDLLFPFVSLSVATILFEGGLSLRIRDIPRVKGVIFSLISIGMLVTWIIVGLAAYFLLGLRADLSILLGAILTVSGPTVVLPLLRHIRPRAPLGEILKWEGILIDPVGALASVLVFEVIFTATADERVTSLLSGLVKPILFGGGFGIAGAYLISYLFTRHLVPDFLSNPFTLMVVLGSHAASNHFAHESGLLAVTLMGVILANTRGLEVRHILEFKENLSILLLSTLFILLAARVEMEVLEQISLVQSALFLGAVIFIARPLSVFLSTISSGLSVNEKLFLCWLAPRGIVAAAVSSLFALELAHVGHPQATLLVSYTFLVIVGTVIIYGLTGDRVALWLGARQARTDGVLFLGAHPFALSLGRVMQNEGIPVIFYDTNYHNVTAARMEGLPATEGNLLTRGFDGSELEGIGRFIAMTPNHEVNSLACLQFGEVFSRSEVYQLPDPHHGVHGDQVETHGHLRGRTLFGEEVTFDAIHEMCLRGAVMKVSGLSDEYTYQDFKDRYIDSHIPVCIINPDETLQFFTTDKELQVTSGCKLVALIAEEREYGREEVQFRLQGT